MSSWHMQMVLVDIKLCNVSMIYIFMDAFWEKAELHFNELHGRLWLYNKLYRSFAKFLQVIANGHCGAKGAFQTTKYGHMKNILVLTDFSDNALHALRYAAMLAKTYHAQTLTLFHSFDRFEVSDENGTEEDQEKEYKAKITQQLTDLHDQELQGLDGVNMQVLAEEGFLLEKINSFCEASDITLIVVGATGKSGWERHFVGSVTTQLLDAVHYPLLIIPHSAIAEPISRVVFASDLKGPLETTQQQLSPLLEALNAQILVLNVDSKEREFGPETTFEMRDLHYYMDHFRSTFYYTEDADTVDGLERFAVDRNASAIITIHRPSGWLERIFSSGTSEKLALHTSLPLLCLYEERR